MTPHQARIVANAPKFRYFRVPGMYRDFLIPDTDSGRGLAIRSGAAVISAFPIYRFDVDGKAVHSLRGDLYFRLLFSRGYAAENRLRALRLFREVFEFRLRVWDCSFIRLTYLGNRKIGVTIPHEYFGMWGQSAQLPRFYDMFLARVRQLVIESGFADITIHRSGWVDVENRRLMEGTNAVPFAWDEFNCMSELDYARAVRSPREVPPIPCRAGLESNLGSELQRQASPPGYTDPEQQRQRGLRCVLSKPLIDAGTGALACGLGYDDGSAKCALRLEAWWRREGIEEFRGRDACRAVDGTYKEVIVGQALRILIAHGYVQECPFPPYSHPGRRPSAWFLVNPKVSI
jgi:hypothetical protein